MAAGTSTQDPKFLWKNLLTQNSDKGINLSFVQNSEDRVRFSEDDLSPGKKQWDLSLVGYSIGKRPFYGALLAAFQRKWKLKGSFQLLSLEGDFFLFKFTCKEDYDLVFDNGPCFLNGRPFIFKKWDWDFSPCKEEIFELPLWIKLPNFPLCCWTEIGFSKVASKIGIPLAVDNLTASRSRITFARVCVQVTPTDPLPSSIPMDLNGKLFDQPVEYDWKPPSCSACNTFQHSHSNCPLNPSKPPPTRGRSRSRTNARRVVNFNSPRKSPVPAQNRESPSRQMADLNALPVDSPPIADSVATPPTIQSPEVLLHSPQVQTLDRIPSPQKAKSPAKHPDFAVPKPQIITRSKAPSPAGRVPDPSVNKGISVQAADSPNDSSPHQAGPSNSKKKKGKGGGSQS